MATLRPALPSDASALASLAGELGYPTTADEMTTRLASLTVNDIVIVSAEGATVTGWIHIAIVPSLESVPFAEIRGLVVTAPARGTGTGRALVAAAEEWGRERGCTRLRVRTNVIREDTHRFYEHRGFRLTKTQRVYDKSL